MMPAYPAFPCGAHPRGRRRMSVPSPQMSGPRDTRCIARRHACRAAGPQRASGYDRLLPAYEAPRELIEKLDAELVEMKRSKANGLCCGAGGAQMFKDAEQGNKEINIERTEDALETQPQIIAAGCPFCNTMLTDGIKNKEKENEIKVMDIAEMIANAQDL